VLIDGKADVGARNERRLVAVNASKESGFEIIHGLLNRLMDILGVSLAQKKEEKESKIPG
jgi:phenylalanyl-tRNA synthetase beta chain